MTAPALDPLVELVRNVGRKLVDHPDDFAVTTAESGQTETLNVTVHADDFGQIIGRQGRTAKALRALVKNAGARRGQRVTVEIVE